MGGGLAGSMAALGLRGRGVHPVVFEQAARIGGRLHGASFMRATAGTRFEPVLAMLDDAGLVAPWRGEFGILGARNAGKGAYLPKRFMPPELLRGLPADGDEGEITSAVRDSGDFCGFIQQPGELYVGTSSNAAICAGICEMVAAEVRTGARVTAAHRVPGAHPAAPPRWELELDGQRDPCAVFDAVIFAVHDPSMAADVIRQAAAADAAEAGSLGVQPLAAEVKARLTDLAEELAHLRVRDDFDIIFAPCATRLASANAATTAATLVPQPAIYNVLLHTVR